MSLQDIHDIYAVNHPKSVIIYVSDGSIINNSNIVSEKLEITDSLCSNNELVFGSCEAACLKIQVATTDKEYKDLWFDVRAIIKDDEGDILLDDGVHYLITDTGERIRMSPYLNSQMIGRFKVVLDEPVADRSWRNLTCYDKMYDIVRADVASWYSGLTFPMTLKAFRDSFFTYLGVEQETATLINDDLVLQGGFQPNGVLYGRTIVSAICELNGVFGHMSMNGKMDYVSLPNGESIEYGYYVDGTGSYERDVVSPITGIIAREDEYDAGTSVGTMTNPYYITGNPLIYGIEGTQDLEDALTALLDKVDDITYRPFGVQSFGDPCVPLGTAVEIETSDITINSYIINKRLTGVQALRDYISAMGTKERLNEDLDLYSYITRTKGKVHELNVDVNQLKSTIYDEDTGLVSEISQMSNEIVLKVDSNGKVVNVALTAEATGTAFKVLADNIDFISNGKIQLTSNSLEINSTKFQVTSAGAVTCSDITISGGGINLGSGKFSVTNAGVLTATSGTIGGWKIEPNRLYSTTVYSSVWSSTALLTPNQVSVTDSVGNYTATYDYESIYLDFMSGGPIHSAVINLKNVNDTSTRLGQALQSASDKRLKKNIKAVDSNLIEAIKECEFKQYNVENKGDNISFGIIAQDFVKACEKRGLNALDYEMIFKDKYSRDDDTEYYMMNYQQLNMLEIISLKSEIESLKKQLTEGK